MGGFARGCATCGWAMRNVGVEVGGMGEIERERVRKSRGMPMAAVMAIRQKSRTGIIRFGLATTPTWTGKERE